MKTSHSVTWGNETATYGYLANSSLVANITFKHGNTTALTTSRTFDNLDRLTEIDHIPAGSGGNVTMAYQYNSRNQRTRATHEDGSYWAYGYDSDGSPAKIGQVTSATTYTANATAFPGLDNAYTYDDIGNRKTAGANALALNGTVAFTGNYYAATNGTGNTGANALNQYGSQDVPRKVDVFGWADANSTVAVNGSNATWVEDFWFNQLSFNGNNSTIYAALNVTATLGGNTTSVTGNRFLSANPEVFSYDADGNLLSDGRWSYTWDAENRLIQMVTSSDAVTAGIAKQKITYAYDDQNRKVQKKVFGWNSGTSAWNSTLDVNLLFLYNGWNLVAEIDASLGTPAPARTFAWGLDLSGSLQDAGGVGGLLMANLGNGTTTQMTYYGYDGNGNVNSLVDTSGNLVASYDYDPSGKILQMSGAWAVYNPMRFSTKYVETTATYGGTQAGLMYYGYRFYNPESGRFINRDPVEELGGKNLYAFCHNDGVNRFDADGRNDDVCTIWDQFVHIPGVPDPYSIQQAQNAQTQNGGQTNPDVTRTTNNNKDNQTPETQKEQSLWTWLGITTPSSPGGPPPPPNIPGGPWTWSPDAQNPRGGKWIGSQPEGGGPKPSATQAPPGVNNENSYWKINDGKGTLPQRYDTQGNPITPEQAHPGPGPNGSQNGKLMEPGEAAPGSGDSTPSSSPSFGDWLGFLGQELLGVIADPLIIIKPMYGPDGQPLDQNNGYRRYGPAGGS